jgi:hypothetical protein
VAARKPPLQKVDSIKAQKMTDILLLAHAFLLAFYEAGLLLRPTERYRSVNDNIGYSVLAEANVSLISFSAAAPL